MIPHVPEPDNENLYTRLVKGAQDLTSRVSAHDTTTSFHVFVHDHNELLKQYIAGYDAMGAEDWQRAGALLNATKQYIHGSLDVLRIQEMRASLLNSQTPERSKRTT